MKKTILVSLAFFIFLILILSSVSAYKLLCLTYGQKLPSAENPRYTCWHDYCINICTTDNYYPTNPRYCEDMGACELFGETEFDVEAPKLTINSPSQDFVYSSRSVLFDITSNEPCSLYYIDNSNGRGGWSRIASNVESYYEKINFKDGSPKILADRVKEVTEQMDLDSFLSMDLMKNTKEDLQTISLSFTGA